MGQPDCNTMRNDGSQFYLPPPSGGGGADIGAGVAILLLPIQLGAAWWAYRLWNTRRIVALVLVALAMSVLVYPIAKLVSWFREVTATATNNCKRVKVMCYNSKQGDILVKEDWNTIADCGVFYDVIV